MDETYVVFQKSEEALKSAKLNLENGFYSSSINRSYYAVFYGAKALLLKKGKNPKTHSGTISLFGLEYTIKDNFNKRISKILSRLEEDRENADYDFSFQSTEDKARKDLKKAELFLEECRKFL
ncbi:MAG: HEPN domain-containing protein [Methanobrevibacter sp.]|nr:HEPN domain-containing protein [Methanobrevibacter sp.]